MGKCKDCSNAVKLNNIFTPEGFAECHYNPHRANYPDEILSSRTYPIVKLERDGCVTGFNHSGMHSISPDQQRLEV
jgi:hypothetical protein